MDNIQLDIQLVDEVIELDVTMSIDITVSNSSADWVHGSSTFITS